MPLFSDSKRARLLANGVHAARSEAFDPVPVVKLITPNANAAWLLSELDPRDPDRAFGLCDLGLGTPELGYVSLAELETAARSSGLTVEEDSGFRPDRTLSGYAQAAHAAGRIVT
ncbi:DUF2958 domain-containing protein [Phenylobacterium sp.]|uniref:DUF2958 domain-containing protein n=1 Tax=Phenylobacterium sp. TaxID=1871053 RepID=UPI003D2B6D5E